MSGRWDEVKHERDEGAKVSMTGLFQIVDYSLDLPLQPFAFAGLHSVINGRRRK